MTATTTPERQARRPLLKAPEAARILAIGTRKLWSLTNCGDIPSIRIGRAVRYDPDDLYKWIQDHKNRRIK